MAQYQQTAIRNKPTEIMGNSFSKIGYKFIGWNTEIDGSGLSCQPNELCSFGDDITLYAQWKKNEGGKLKIGTTLGNEYEFEPDEVDYTIYHWGNVLLLPPQNEPLFPYSKNKELSSSGSMLYINNESGQISNTLNYNSFSVDRLISVNCSGLQEIENHCFRNQCDLSSVSIPNIKKIGDYAFYDCSSLEWICMSGVTEPPEICANTFGPFDGGKKCSIIIRDLQTLYKFQKNSVWYPLLNGSFIQTTLQTKPGNWKNNRGVILSWNDDVGGWEVGHTTQYACYLRYNPQSRIWTYDETGPHILDVPTHYENIGNGNETQLDLTATSMMGSRIYHAYFTRDY